MQRVSLRSSSIVVKDDHLSKVRNAVRQSQLVTRMHGGRHSLLEDVYDTSSMSHARISDDLRIRAVGNALSKSALLIKRASSMHAY